MKFFLPHEEKKIVAAIGQAELKTSAEIRVHLTRHCRGSPYDEAVKVFEKLGMVRTAERNGVLIYLLPKQRKFAVIGDIGIHKKVSPDFWDQVRDVMQDDFKRGDFVKGLIDGIQTCGEQLACHFPRRTDDKDELPNEMSGEIS